MSKETIQDIAASAGVSVGTVSKVLNGDKTVKEKNRKAVELAVAHAGYNVNKLARSLAHKPITLGILLPSVFDEYFSPMIHGIEQVVASLADYKVRVIYCSYDHADDRATIDKCIADFVKEKVSGILLGPMLHIEAADHLLLQENNIPIVLMVSDVKGSHRLACISIDAELSGRTAAELADLIMAPDSRASVMIGTESMEEHRLKAHHFCRRLTELRCTELSDVWETKDDPKLAYRQTCAILKNDPSPRIFYIATGNSLAVCKAICDSNRQANVRVIATDVLKGLAPYIENGLVVGVLDQHFHEQGVLAVQTLHRYLTEGVLTSSVIQLPPCVLLRSAMLERLQKNM